MTRRGCRMLARNCRRLGAASNFRSGLPLWFGSPSAESLLQGNCHLREQDAGGLPRSYEYCRCMQMTEIWRRRQACLRPGVFVEAATVLLSGTGRNSSRPAAEIRVSRHGSGGQPVPENWRHYPRKRRRSHATRYNNDTRCLGRPCWNRTRRRQAPFRSRLESRFLLISDGDRPVQHGMQFNAIREQCSGVSVHETGKCDF